MKKILGLGLAAIGMFALAACDQISVGPKKDPLGPKRHIIIGLDISKSNPLVTDRAFAAAVGAYVRDEIEGAPPRSEISLRTFGLSDAGNNPLRVDRTVSTKAGRKPADIGNLMNTLISAVPKMADDGTITLQLATNIVSFLNNTGQIVKCDEFETLVILATDGIEESRYARMSRPNEQLPLPERAMFSGCAKLLILGVGQGRNNPELTQHLRNEWRDWAEAAGFEEFVALNNW